MSTGVTETIWHFAGYLHLIEEVARSWKFYEDDPSPMRGEDLPEAPPPALPWHYIEPVFSQPSPFWAAPAVGWSPEPMLLLRGSPRVDPQRPDFDSPDLPSLEFDIGVGRGGGTSISITLRAAIEREDAFGETVAEIRQLNLMDDSDHFVWGEDVTADLLPIDPAGDMLGLFDAVDAAMPDALVVPRGQAEVAQTLQARLETLANAEPDETLAAHTTGPGRFVDGVAVDADWERAETAPPDMPEGRNGHEAVGAHAELGGNEATNLANIQDLNELTLQTIVFGDHYSLDAIVQINAIMDVDRVHAFSETVAATAADLAGDETPHAWTGGNSLTNIAEFLERDLDFGAVELPGRGGLHWTVDVLDGDFWDLKSILQTNWITDDDVYSKTEYEHFSQVRMGENTAINLAEFLQAAGDYDMIVIGGNSYSANWIVQTNILLDSDGVLVGHRGGVGDQTGATGQNTLTNDALIATYGGGVQQTLDADLAAFVQRLLTDDTTDPADWWEVNGIGSGSMRVLYVTGDYWDVNLITQLNVVSDADTLAQILPADAIGPDGSAEQWVSTGGNQLTNAAIIVDTEAAVATHVGGDVYEEDFLVQAEIVIQDDDDWADGELAPELVAFTGGDEIHTDDDAFVGAPLAGQGDVMGAVMT